MEKVKTGDEVLILELSSYVKKPQTPVMAIIKRVDPYPYVVVEIGGKEYEAYEHEYEVIKKST